jgi:hypothetical protein
MKNVQGYRASDNDIKSWVKIIEEVYGTTHISTKEVLGLYTEVIALRDILRRAKVAESKGDTEALFYILMDFEEPPCDSISSAIQQRLDLES